MDAQLLWGAHAPRVLVAVPRRNELVSRSHIQQQPKSKEKVRDVEGAIASTRGACAPQIAL
jgi:hypothetical protein